MLIETQLAPIGCTTLVKLSAIVTCHQLQLPVAARAASVEIGLHS
jgi:hypothetical protein